MLEAFNLLVHQDTPAYILDEIAGIANVTGIKASLLEGMANLPEIIRGSCSMVGALPPAVPDDSLHQFRALMLKPFLTFQAFPVVAISHNGGDLPVEARIGYLGLGGVLTGFNSANLGISEKSHVSSMGGECVSVYGLCAPLFGSACVWTSMHVRACA